MKHIIALIIFGFISLEVYPIHNDPLTVMKNSVARYRIEAELNVIEHNNWSLKWNPIFWGDGVWPEQSFSYKPMRWWLDNSIIIEYKYNNLSFFFRKINYYELLNRYNLEGNWTYANGIGIIYKW